MYQVSRERESGISENLGELGRLRERVEEEEEEDGEIVFIDLCKQLSLCYSYCFCYAGGSASLCTMKSVNDLLSKEGEEKRSSSSR